MAKQNQGPRPVPQQARPAPTASRSGETVTVACKLPSGLVLRGFRKTIDQELVLGGGLRDVTKYVEDGRREVIYGNARPKGGSFRTRVVCGYALTQGISKTLWDEWLEANAEMPAVKNRLVFAFPNVDMAADAAREHRKTRSGLEPLSARIEDDPRTPHPINPDVGQLRMETEKMKAEQFEESLDEEMA